LLKFAQKIFADLFGDTGATDEGFYSLFCDVKSGKSRDDFQFATAQPLCYNAHDNS
jgi:hypothetical protein